MINDNEDVVVLMEKYKDMGFNKLQLECIERGIELQLKYIERGIKLQLDVSKYADPKFSWQQMEQIFLGLKDQLRCIDYLIDPRFDEEQMGEIRLWLKSCPRDMSYFADPKFNHKQMQEIRLGLEKGLPVYFYLDHRFSWERMNTIRYYLCDQDIANFVKDLGLGLDYICTKRNT